MSLSDTQTEGSCLEDSYPDSELCAIIIVFVISNACTARMQLTSENEELKNI